MKCYVINLDRSKDRLEHITRVFDEQRLSFERVAAVDGTLLSEEELNHLTAKSTWQPKLTAAEVGCFLSHRECLHRIAEGSDPWVAVFEDDAMLSLHIGPLLRDPEWIPKTEKIGVIKLDTNTIGMICVLGKRQKLTNAKGEIRPYRLAPLLSQHYGTAAYIISKQCAKKLYDLIQDITAPIDVILFDQNTGLLQELNVHQLIPAPVIQSGMTSTIGYSKKIKKNISLQDKAVREAKRIYRRNLLPIWQMLTRGYYTGKIPFK